MKISKTLEQNKKMFRNIITNLGKEFTLKLEYLDSLVGKDITRFLNSVEIPYLKLTIRQKKLFLAFILIVIIICLLYFLKKTEPKPIKKVKSKTKNTTKQRKIIQKRTKIIERDSNPITSSSANTGTTGTTTSASTSRTQSSSGQGSWKDPGYEARAGSTYESYYGTLSGQGSGSSSTRRHSGTESEVNYTSSCEYKIYSNNGNGPHIIGVGCPLDIISEWIVLSWEITKAFIFSFNKNNDIETIIGDGADRYDELMDPNSKIKILKEKFASPESDTGIVSEDNSRLQALKIFIIAMASLRVFLNDFNPEKEEELNYRIPLGILTGEIRQYFDYKSGGKIFGQLHSSSLPEIRGLLKIYDMEIGDFESAEEIDLVEITDDIFDDTFNSQEKINNFKLLLKNINKSAHHLEDNVPY